VVRQRMGYFHWLADRACGGAALMGDDPWMKPATGLSSGALLPAVAFLVHVAAGLAAAGLVSSVASRQGNARLVFLQRQGCPGRPDDGR
jgi:hypothetical protein